MKALPNEARSKNLSGRDYCRYCLNDGYVVASFRKPRRTLTAGASATETFEELGPCPMCEVGFKVEYQEGSPWDAEGFWQGRDLVELQPFNSDQGWKHATGPQARQMLEALGRTIGVVMDVAVGAVPRSDSSPSQDPPAAATSTSSSSGDNFGEVPK